MSHPDSVTPYTNEELALALSRMRYDALTEVLTQLACHLKADAEADYIRDRRKLYACLNIAGVSVEKAAHFVGRAWGICEIHMKGDQ